MSTPTTTPFDPPVLLSQARSLVAEHEADADRYMLGLADDGAPAWWRPSIDGPMEFVAGTGAGGTTALRALALQAVWESLASVDVLDSKGTCWRDLDSEVLRDHGLSVHTPVRDGLEAMADVIADAAHDVRARRCDAHGAWDSADRLILVDDLATLDLLARREADRDDWVREDLAEILRDGAPIGVHLVTRSPRGSGQVLPGPGPDRRALALARVSAGVLKDVPGRISSQDVPGGGSDRPAGRWLICQGQSRTTVRVPAALVGADPFP